MPLESLQQRVNSLQTQANRYGGFVQDESWYQFRVSPTCPPSKELHMQGGRMYATYNPTGADLDDYEYRAWTVPSLTADLADVNSVTVDVTFEHAGYYQFFILELRIPLVVEQPSASDWWFYLHTIYNEFATAGEAEAWSQSEAFQYDPDEDCAWKHPPYPNTAFVAYPLCGLVLKNDGNPGGGCPILPVDLVNRGRSYMWPVDMRPITSIYD